MVGTVGDWLRGRGLCEDASPVLEGAARSYSGRELCRLVGAAAVRLRAEGVREGDRVAVLLPRGVDEAVQLLAVIAAGAIAVPIHTRLRDEQVAHVLADARPRLCVTSAARQLALHDPSRALGAVPLLEPRLDLDGTPGAGFSGSVGPADPAVILYTSGSTGRAKGIVQTHGNLVSGADIVCRYLRLQRHDRLLSLLSFSFDYGLNQLLTTLAARCHLTIADHLGAGELATLLRRHRPTGLAGVPSFWHEVAAGLEAGTFKPEDGASLRFVTNSGGRLWPADSARLRASWPQADVYAMYGLTEAFRSAFLPPDEFDEAPESFGYAVEGVELLLVDVETGEVLEGPGQGELVHAGDLVAAGYWQRPEASARRFRPDPRGNAGTVVYSGDLVRRDDRGRHYFVARLDRMMKVQGHRVSPDEVAREAAGAEGIARVAVFGVPDGPAGDRVVLFCEGDPDDASLVERVTQRCRSRLPSYMQPRDIRVLAALPHNANGKVDEAALRGIL